MSNRTTKRNSRHGSAANASNNKNLVEIENRQLTALKTIMDNTSLNTFGKIESVPDVPKLKLAKNKVYTFTRDFVYSNNLTSTDLVYGALGMQFTLSSAPNYTEFTSLFDQYRIIQISVTALPRYITQPYTMLSSAIDYDDSTNPGSAGSEVYEKDTCRITTPLVAHTRILSPRTLGANYLTITSTAYSTDYGEWIDSANASVPYYGLKWYMPQLVSTTAASNIIAFQVNMVIQGRSPS